jgi:prepilin-type N-terminal cleavage/methylation domain-containing protein
MPRPPNRTGFSLVEVLIALALLAAILTAVAAAIQASLQSYRDNETITEATQTARSCLARMMREVRTADEVDSTSTSLTIIPPLDGSGLTQIQYELSGGALYYRRTVGGATTSQALLATTDDVRISSFNISRVTGTSGGTPYTKSVTVRIGLSADGQSFYTTASASLRRNQEY